MVAAHHLCATELQPGQEGQVDWYEAWAELAGEQASCRYSRCAAWRAARPSIERIIARRSRHFSKPTSRHSLILVEFFAPLRYDNLKSAVKKVLRGHRARRPRASSPSARTGASRATFARRRNPMKKAESKVRLVIFAGVTGCRCRRRGISRS